MTLAVALFFLFSNLMLSGEPTPDATKVSWSNVVAVVSILFNAFLGIMFWLLNRKRESEQELQKKAQVQLDDATTNVQACIMSVSQAVQQVDQLKREIGALQHEVENLAEDATVVEIRSDFRSMKRDLEEARISLAGHQNACADRFVHRSSYSEDLRAQRETVMLIHELINQQRGIIERIRS